MSRQVITIREDAKIGELVELLVQRNVHGVPVVDGDDALVGVVSRQDVFIGAGMGTAKPDDEMLVKDVMTSPAVSAEEDADLPALCKLMVGLRIHRIPIVRDGKVSGVVSSLDVCRAMMGEAD